MQTQAKTLTDLARELTPRFRERAREQDQTGRFVHDNYKELRAEGAMSALVPQELGGLGASLAELCAFLRDLAKACPSTALALSMHQHLVAAVVWKWRNKGEGEAMLRRLVTEQLVLLSTGASDWVESNGTARRVEGGYRLNATKVFGSGGPAADLMIASIRYDCPEAGASVLHFSLSMQAEGVRSLEDWDTLGMRATGSHTQVLEEVFLPESAVVLKRPAGRWHPVWTVAMTGALPIVMAPYLGIAEQAAQLAQEAGARRPEDPHLPYFLGELGCALTNARLNWRGLIENAGDYDYDLGVATADRALQMKTNCAAASQRVVELAMQACGGRSFFRGFGLEQLFRDVQAAAWHPLPEKKQQLFSGRLAMGLDPCTGAAG